MEPLKQNKMFMFFGDYIQTSSDFGTKPIVESYRKIHPSINSIFLLSTSENSQRMRQRLYVYLK